MVNSMIDLSALPKRMYLLRITNRRWIWQGK